VLTDVRVALPAGDPSRPPITGTVAIATLDLALASGLPYQAQKDGN